MMDMPTQCPGCKNVVELQLMEILGSELYCEECYYELKEEEE